MTTKTKSLGAGVQGVEQWVAWEVARLAPIIQALRADGDKVCASELCLLYTWLTAVALVLYAVSDRLLPLPSLTP